MPVQCEALRIVFLSCSSSFLGAGWTILEFLRRRFYYESGSVGLFFHASPGERMKMERKKGKSQFRFSDSPSLSIAAKLLAS